MEAEIVMASSPADAGVGCWDLRTGSERLRYKTCVSPPHGLVSIGNGGFLACSQIRERKSSSSGSVFYWSWNKAQVEVKSFIAEPVGPIVSDTQGSFVVGGGVSGDIYLWEVASGKLLKKWHGHYRAVTCLVLNDDESLLLSGAEDGCVRVWSLYLMFDDARREKVQPYERSFLEHTLKVTDVKSCFSGLNALIVSASEDRTCKVWRLSTGELVRNVIFPSAVNAISVDPWNDVIYAGAGDGKIYISALSAPLSATSSYGKHIIDAFSEQRRAVTCLASNADGSLLVSGSEDGLVIVWDTRTRNFLHSLRHTKGPVNNVQVITQRQYLNPYKPPSSTLRRNGSTLPPPLEKFVTSLDENLGIKAVVHPPAASIKPPEPICYSVQFMEDRIKDLQRRDPSSEPTQAEVERLRSDLQRANQMVQQWKKMNENLHQLCVDQLLSDGRGDDDDRR